MSDDLQAYLTSLREAEVPVPVWAAVRELAGRRRRALRVAVVIAACVVAASGVVAVTTAQSDHRPLPLTAATSRRVAFVDSPRQQQAPPRTSASATVVTPNVIGMSAVEATRTLQEISLTVVVLPSSSTRPASTGTVVTQSPVAGTLVPISSTVSLTVDTPASVGALPDGSALPNGCALPPTQAETPAPDDVVVASDSCALGEFSVSTGRVVRYLSSATNVAWLGPDGGVWFGVYGCDRPLMELPPGGQSTAVVSAAAARVLWPFAVGGGRAAWGVGPCDVGGGSQTSTATTITVWDTASRDVAWAPGRGAITAQGMALSDDHRLAVAFSRSDGTTQCPASGDGCPKILVAGISVVDAGASTIPDPSIKPASGCSFGALTWSQAHLLAVEECPISSDAMYADRRVSRLVRIDPADGKRLATIELPSDYPVMDRVDGMRTLSNGDILVSMGSAKVGSHLLRVHDYVATAIEMHGNFVAESP